MSGLCVESIYFNKPVLFTKRFVKYMADLYSVVSFVEVNSNAGAMIFGIYVILVVNYQQHICHIPFQNCVLSVENFSILRFILASSCKTSGDLC